MNTCKHCGNQWTDGRAHCPKCGVRHLAAPQVVAKSATTEKSCGADRPRCIDYDCKHNYFNGQCWRDGGACKWRSGPMTNGDRIRTMSDEELARYIDVCMLPDRYLTDHYMSERAIDVILEWMKQEVE